ncbi:helix-turn-helix transcriptional regulator (plasmid) [Azospirillum oryzae]|uniref:Helix-turn-helix transcriptional regulator n=1 Tax=Azospirillum oryzae TaxID=286727 RepID=A0A6N1AQV5_9PROT|nr:helix-turn-helix transcriptional regulator [Azospirillum oryzae]KAA0587901.1 helix-turn-helix transcriptional regulator [Azospirillum oryzae]QKS54016.1 helix-turn-helix transcriptional regulator [Azospirillum oryzae]GLR77822.1 putative HTH-type transcriptional regulator y4dJ [Azospirillum oryzae]
MEDLPDILAANIRRLRRERGFSQEELAHRSGIDRSYLGQIERAEHKATVVTLGKVAKALAVLPGDLLTLPSGHPYLSELAAIPRPDGDVKP